MATTESLEFVSAKALRALLERPQTTTVSIYQPTNRVAIEPEENSLHLKNLLAKAKEQLVEEGRRPPEAAELLEPASTLLSDDDFWMHQLEGLAIFVDEQGMNHYRLPEEVPAVVSVSDGPLVKPLLSSVYPAIQFYMLALSQNDLRLLNCSRYQAEQVDLSRYDIPISLEESLRFDDLEKPELQHHPTTAPGRGPIGERTGADRRHGFHGHGESGEGQKTQVRGHFHNVSRVLDKVLGAESTPLVLCGVEWIQALYREVTSYRPILDDYVEGNPDGLSIPELHERAVPIVSKHRRKELESWKEEFGSYIARGTGSTDLESVLPAAHEGRISRLFIRRGAEAWGTFDPAEQAVEISDTPGPGNNDLYDLAVRQVVMTDGQALLLEENDMPATEPVAAIFRW